MGSTSTWPGGFTNHQPGFGASFDNAVQSNEDWEDWLRWDPAAEPASPEDGTFHSGSSKIGSPLQDSALPGDLAIFGKDAVNDTLAPPLIVGEDALDFGAGTLPGEEPFLFAATDDAVARFDFNSTATFLPIQPTLPRLDTDAAAWLLPLDSPPNSINLAALSNGNRQQQPFSAVSQTATTPSLNYSPESAHKNSTSSDSAVSSNPPKKRGGRKRKAELIDQQDEPTSLEGDGEPPIKKGSHNVIEKRYRNNLNDKIVELRNSVPSLRAMGREKGFEDLDGLTPAHKLNKATVMGKATEYIRHLEKRNAIMAEEMEVLHARLAAVEEAIGKPKDRRRSISNSPTSTTGRSRQASSSSSSQAAPQTYLTVPVEQNRHGQQVTPQQYIQQQPQPQYAPSPGSPSAAQDQPQNFHRRRGGVRNKVMMGAMAGLMIMEGFSGQQGDDDPQGLSAAPVGLFKRGLDARATSSPAAFARHAGLPLLKICLVVGVLFHLLASLFSFSPRRKQKTKLVVRLPAMPSLASPVEVRRKAWLTALQTVYVPKHFLLEVAAVTTKMASLSLRRLIGSEVYNTLTGTNKEDEAARVKAWDIAIDAQLAGGDQEVSYHRLLLTLMASGTLPDTPTRLMQKAVHFRVFFWEVAHAGYGNMIGFKQFTEKVGKFYWDSARKLQKELVHAKAQGRPREDDEVELLPDHLASLVELECADVLGDEMIQRAWNLAWDKPTAYGTTLNAARDSVVEDHAIRAPLDAVAAWYANFILDDALADALAAEHRPSPVEADYRLALATTISPPASTTQVRALTAKAVLVPTDRETSILAALEALPVASAISAMAGTMNLVPSAPASPDIPIALTLAKLLTLASSTSPSTARQRAFTTLSTTTPLAPADLTLLTAAAAHNLLHLLVAQPGLPVAVRRALEELAGALRLWAGTSAGALAGLDQRERGRVVDGCLRLAKEVGGWQEEEERDSGYGGSNAGGSPVRAMAEMRP